jgi:hypothetical protein
MMLVVGAGARHAAPATAWTCGSRQFAQAGQQRLWGDIDSA